ncbi:YjcZ family sporulation protein [Evansella sp. AB-rgal1]|uniref:YjcZ family sporulation protein n=1 Tax=Evansella sp. AB-rgal1 TaxID=3242696 RepID=UPI00359DCE39
MSHYHGYGDAYGAAPMGYGYGEPGYYGCCSPAPAAPVAAPAQGGGFAGGFALILVLFILLVIIGAALTAAY